MPWSLAPFYYRNVRRPDGGPVDRIATSPRFEWEGRTYYEATAVLREDLRAPAYKEVLYGSSDGSGRDESRATASSKAISEALERWAFYACVSGSRRSDYGFGVDPSTTGMAAFPGLGSGPARARAFLEAVCLRSRIRFPESASS